MIKYTIIIITLTISISCGRKYAVYEKEIDLHRKEKKKELATDQRFPLKTENELEGIKYFTTHPKYNLSCAFVKTTGAQPFDLPTYSGKTRAYIEYGRLTCPIEKSAIKLVLYRSMANLQIYKNHLFLPFKDETSGIETYGGGRYIDLKIDDIKDNIIQVDFNKSYNPWCAYSDGFNCPIPPKENHLTIPIKAGERNFTGTHKTIDAH